MTTVKEVKKNKECPLGLDCWPSCAWWDEEKIKCGFPKKEVQNNGFDTKV